jgi:hypothetical protein
MWLAMSGLFRPRWSSDIHREWMTAVNNAYGIPIEDLIVRRDSMDAAVLDSRVTGYEDLIVGLELPDPNDRHVLAAAIRCGATAIVTFNERDFPVESLEKYGIEARHPDDFILEVDGIDPGTLIDAAKSDLAHYVNPKLDVETYIEGLRVSGVPKTSDYLRKTKVLLQS